MADEFSKRADRTEAGAWLAGHRGRTILGEEPADARRHVQTLYNLGAKEVLVADIDREDRQAEDARQMLIVLPDDPAQRRSVIDYARQNLDESIRDTGQNSILLT
jgi:hypothetical protein